MKIVIIDDEGAMHLIMRRMLGKIKEVEVVGCFLDTIAAYSYMENHEVDLVLVDISMPRESGIEFAERLRARDENIKIVFVTSHKEYALSAFDVYASDYIVKPVTQDRLLRTIQRVFDKLLKEVAQVDRWSIAIAAGADMDQKEPGSNLMKNSPDRIEGRDLTYQLFESHQLTNHHEHMKPHIEQAERNIREAPPLLIDPLTNRETEILLALAEGLSNKEIADRYMLTEGTVKNHLYNLYSKLGVKRRAQAIKRARELRILK
ncbi:response regulator transcription factor [Paenibacillus periandrae]|uniref:response regulator transcription factor n=1 Tax=Paenibacillus periandrae TaxID=1761741 RepID=UPI001F09665B|nr:response regulator transcription factor [Paenibacillus periandrae]